MSGARWRDYAYLWWLYYGNRVRLVWLRRGLSARVEFGRGADVWATCLRFQGLGRARFGEGSILERGPHVLVLDTEPGGMIDIGARVYIRTKYCASVLTVFEGAAIEIGADSMLNGCIISARERVKIGRHCCLSWRVTILDANLHTMSNDEPEKISAVGIGDHCWLGSDVTVLPGVHIGDHCVIAAGSVVTRDLPNNVLAAGSPAKVIREIGDRDRAR